MTKYKDPCEWNSETDSPAYDDEVHAEAEYIVGANGQYRLCAKCTELKRFNRFKKKLIIKNESYEDFYRQKNYK